MSEGMTATWIELEERDAKAITDRLQRDATNGDMAHNALADALIWNIEHNIASSKMIFAVPDTIIKKLKAENMCADGITIPLPGGRSIKATGTGGVLCVLSVATVYGLMKIHGVI